jgi:hypothetical protein
MARQIWIFPFPVDTPNSFGDVAGLMRYVADEIFSSESCRLRHSLQRDANDGDIVILSQAAQLYGHFEITGWEEPNANDLLVFPIVRRVYIVGRSFLYTNPVSLSDIEVTQIRFGKDVTEDKFQQIIRLAGSIEQFSDVELPDSAIELERVLREVKRRLGQCQFRQQLVTAYESRCAMTGYDAIESLEAAHIDPYAGPTTNHTSNGLLLRGDIHTLFDLELIAINPDTLAIAVHSSLLPTTYASLNGKRIRLPTDATNRPGRAALERRWRQFVGPSE